MKNHDKQCVMDGHCWYKIHISPMAWAAYFHTRNDKCVQNGPRHADNKGALCTFEHVTVITIGVHKTWIVTQLEGIKLNWDGGFSLLNLMDGQMLSGISTLSTNYLQFQDRNSMKDWCLYYLQKFAAEDSDFSKTTNDVLASLSLSPSLSTSLSISLFCSLTFLIAPTEFMRVLYSKYKSCLKPFQVGI